MTPDLITGIKWYLVFLFSDRIHEAAHAWAALKLGDDTAYRGGQATLDPTPQLRREPIGMAVAPILSYLAGAARTEATERIEPQLRSPNARRSILAVHFEKRLVFWRLALLAKSVGALRQLVDNIMKPPSS